MSYRLVVAGVLYRFFRVRKSRGPISETGLTRTRLRLSETKAVAESLSRHLNVPESLHKLNKRCADTV